jgi:integral membrane protein (TIGR01906 family)
MNKAIHWLIILLMPVFLGFGVIRAVIAWDYPAWEYGRIAPDAYGWTPAERLDRARATLDYMQRPERAEQVIYLLEELRLPEDPTQPLYNEREIEHMLDVKHLTDNIRNIFWVTAVLVLGGLAFLWARPDGRTHGRLALYRGGWATVLVLTGIALFILVGWSFFFVFFHDLLFPPGTWTFYYTDSLIRLFPEQFWFDMGLILSLTPLALGIVLTAVGYTLTRHRS